MAYVSFSAEQDGGHSLKSVTEQKTIALTEKETAYSFTFTNWEDVSAFDFSLMLGAFSTYKKDYDGEDVSDVMQEEETYWAGQLPCVILK